MTIKKGDFIELSFTGKIAITGDVFDTNIESDAKSAGLETKNLKPFIMAVGQKMLPGGLDSDIEGKEVGKGYEITLKPVDAFGKRDQKAIRMIPTKLFHEQNIEPKRGMPLNLDGQMAKVLSSSGGRTLVDFNNPLAGKEVLYDYKINRIVTSEKEKINALQEFFFKKTFEYDKKDKKIILKVTKEIEPLAKMLAPKFKEIIDLEMEAVVIEEKKKEKAE